MFFELDDVQRRHNPSWWTNNVTTWTTAVDSTPSWNFQRGNIIKIYRFDHRFDSWTSSTIFNTFYITRWSNAQTLLTSNIPYTMGNIYKINS